MAIFWYPQQARTPQRAGRIPRSQFIEPGVQPEVSERISFVDDDHLDGAFRSDHRVYALVGVVLLLPLVLVSAAVPLLAAAVPLLDGEWWEMAVLVSTIVATALPACPALFIHRRLRQRRLR